MNSKRRGIYTVIGDPIPLFRAKPNYHSRVMFDSQKNLRMYWRCLLEKMHGRKAQYSGPLRLEVIAFIELPATKKKRADLLNSYHQSPPDSSNILKWVEDCAQEVLFKNDCAIADSRCIKVWTNNPKTIFIITELDPASQFNPEDFGL
jgi:Holliday junction resolvase RusA-like endonuclease